MPVQYHQKMFWLKDNLKCNVLLSITNYQYIMFCKKKINNGHPIKNMKYNNVVMSKKYFFFYYRYIIVSIIYNFPGNFPSNSL